MNYKEYKMCRLEGFTFMLSLASCLCIFIHMAFINSFNIYYFMGKRERKSGAANEKQIEKSIREKQKKQHWKRKFCNFPEVFGNACAKCNTNDLFYCIFHTVSE